MTQISPYLPLFELTRGGTVESIHHGAVVVADAHGEIVAWWGDPDAVTFLRSTSKPFQALPFVEHGGAEVYNLTPREVALLCASHTGTDEHVTVLQGIQAKTGVSESQLLCGVHDPYHEPTAAALRERKERPTSNRHNCSGKHTGMLAFVRLMSNAGMQFEEDQPYIEPAHPIQQMILKTIAEMSQLPVEQIGIGIDGCSAPNFAMPLRNAALAFARLCDPETGTVTPGKRAAACRAIVEAMTSNPDMVSGPASFDTRLMEVARGRIVTKGGAEGYQGIGILPGALGPGSPALGIVLKIADGDARGKVRRAVALEVLLQLGALSDSEMASLSEFGPRFPVLNWRKVLVGQGYPIFILNRPG